MIVSGHDAERDLNEAMVLVNQIPTLWETALSLLSLYFTAHWLLRHCLFPHISWIICSRGVIG